MKSFFRLGYCCYNKMILLKKFCYELFVIYKVKYLLYMLNFMDEWLSRERDFKKVLVFECMNFIK